MASMAGTAGVAGVTGVTAMVPGPDARRGTGMVFAVIALAALFVLAMGGVGAGADPEQQRAIVGSATVEPGETLWDVAVAHAPEGSDPRAYLNEIRDLNRLDAGSIPPWTVVLLPAP